MHIKQVIIQGFKSYKDQTILEPFDSSINVIVGRNGSGKSNVYNAIQFVLSDKYSHLGMDERQKILYYGSGRDVMSASVEVIFDNADSRFPIEQDEISIKRTIGLKKDEYFLNNKHMSKTEVVNLLESAGFSRANPYYIVEQGKVRNLINMKDSERLELLKEIAGTRTYDERRKESLKIMANTDNRQEQIQEVIEYIEKRLAELEEEKKELRDFQELDGKRKALEYTIYSKELVDAEESILEIEEKHKERSQHTSQTHGNVQKVERERAELEEEIRLLTEYIAKDKSQLNQLKSARKKDLKDRAQIELAVQAEQDKKHGIESQRSDTENELKDLELEIAREEAKLETLTSSYRELLEKEEDIRLRLDLNTQRVNELYDKQGRSEQFNNKRDRDKYLSKELKQANKTLNNDKKQLKALDAENKKKMKEIKAISDQIDAHGSKVEQLKRELEEADARNHELKEERDQATNERKELWREGSQTGRNTVGTYRNALAKAQKKLQYTMDKSLWKGLEAVKEITKELKLTGVYGPLIDLVSCDQKFRNCVETTAGNSFFHVVVDTDQTATRIIKELNERNAGRITFIPLNRIQEKKVVFPESNDVIPMIDKLQYEAKFDTAVKQVFGKTLVARSLQVASQIARQYNLDTITLNGDQINKKGAVTGGYFDRKRNRMESHLAYKEAQEAYDKALQDSEDHQQRLSEKDQQVAAVLGEIHKIHEQKNRARAQINQTEMELKNAHKTQGIIKKSLERNEQTARHLKGTIEQIAQRIQALEQEIASDFTDDLNSQETNDIRELNEEITELKRNLIKATDKRSKAETAKSVLETLLSDNLLRRQEELTELLASQTQDESSDRLEVDQQELLRLRNAVRDANDMIGELESKVEQTSTLLTDKQGALEELKNQESSQSRKLAKGTKVIQILLNKKSVAMQRREDCVYKIRNLGTIPSGVEKFAKRSVSQLMHQLESINNKLKKYSHVNKKAIDQYINFTEQKGDLISRKHELDEGRQSIHNLITHLDMKKDHAIERTFKGIAKHFSEVFAELVPGGKGTLVIQTKGLGEMEEQDEKQPLSHFEEEQDEMAVDSEGEEEDARASDEDIETKSNSKRKKSKRTTPNKRRRRNPKSSSSSSSMVLNKTAQYVGVGIKVSFTGDQAQSMAMFSGGQQSVIALALIFAIQRCDPSPFYIFDEIDSALDEVYRLSVSRMIQQYSKNTQFIMTTFRPEMLGVADQCYGVTSQHHVSKVKVIERDEAAEILRMAEIESTGQ